VSTLDPADPKTWSKQLVPELRDIPLARFRAELLLIFNGSQPSTREPSSWPFVSDVIATTSNFVADGSDATGFRIRLTDSGGKAPKDVAYLVKLDDEYLVRGLAGSAASSDEAFARVQKDDLTGARQWLDWANDELPRTNAPDPMAIPAFQRLWPPKPGASPEFVKAAAAVVAARGKNYEPAVLVLGKLREGATDPELQTALDQGLAQALLQHGKYADAVPALERLRTKWPSSELLTYNLAQAFTYSNRFNEASALIEPLERSELTGLQSLRLREQLFAQQGKFKEAALLQAKICMNLKAAAYDWNDLAWIYLVAPGDPKAMRDAAVKAAQMTGGGNISVLQTLAVVQASTGLIQEARANAYLILGLGGETDELYTIFGRIDEELDLRDPATDYYQRIKKPDAGSTLSNYAFAQMRLKEMALRKQ
ncbi:MAG: tetratricopeptide repeat protein, partial [Bryobacteraceae bacterium]